MKRKMIKVSTGTISIVDVEVGLVGVVDASGRITNYNALLSNLFDTDGNRIFFDELRPGDQVIINETGYLSMIRVLKIA